MELSILVPVYNTGKYLKRCVDSLVAQTISDYEIILVDDGSTDGSGMLCDKLAAEHAQVRVIHQANGGLSAARLTGIRASHGAYLAFVDSDDYVESDFYARLLEPVREDAQIEVSIGGLMQDADGVFSYPYRADEAITWDDGMAALEEMVRGEKFIWNLADKIYARRLFVDEKPVFSYRGNYGEDLYFNAMAVPHARKVVFQPVYGYHYCMHEESLTHQAYHAGMLPILTLWVNLLYCFSDREFLAQKFSSYFVDFAIAGLTFLQKNRSAKLTTYQEVVREGMKYACLSNLDREALTVLLYDAPAYRRWKKKTEKQMMTFCTSGGEQTYIYGTGVYGRRAAELLSSMRLDFIGFAETKKKSESCLGHPVKSIDALAGSEKLLLGMDRKHTQEVEEMLGERFPQRLRLCTYLACT